MLRVEAIWNSSIMLSSAWRKSESCETREEKAGIAENYRSVVPANKDLFLVFSFKDNDF